MAGGMVSTRSPPACIPTMPSSHPDVARKPTNYEQVESCLTLDHLALAEVEAELQFGQTNVSFPPKKIRMKQVRDVQACPWCSGRTIYLSSW